MLTPPYKLVACDLDGTLLTPEHRLGAYTQGVLARLQARGVQLLLASGRHFQDISRLSGQLGGRGSLISSNGAAIHDRDGRPVRETVLDADAVGFLVSDPAFAGVHTNVYRSRDWLVGVPEPRLLGYHRDSGFAYRVADLKAMDRREVIKVFFYGEPAHLHDLEALVLERLAGRVSTTFSLPFTFEVMAAGVSKGAALAWVAQRLEIGLDEVIAFGDGMNDLEMLAVAGKGVLMGNADARLAAALPDLERIGSNGDEAVARYLEAW